MAEVEVEPEHEEDVDLSQGCPILAQDMALPQESWDSMLFVVRGFMLRNRVGMLVIVFATLLLGATTSDGGWRERVNVSSVIIQATLLLCYLVI